MHTERDFRTQLKAFSIPPPTAVLSRAHVDITALITTQQQARYKKLAGVLILQSKLLSIERALGKCVKD